MTPRYEVSPITLSQLRVYNIYDTIEHRVLCTTWFVSDAEKLVNRLNLTVNPTLRTMLAVELADFRVKLEQDNGGPLTDGDPTIALLLADMCDAFHFTEGERAIVLGRDLIIYLARLDQPLPIETPEPATLPAGAVPTDQLIIIQA